jgi:hypothetical protein
VSLAGAGASGVRAANPGFNVRAVEPATWLSIAALAAVGMAIWFRALATVDLTQLTDIGLASVVPPWAFLAFQLVTVAFVLALAQPRFPTWLMVVLVSILIVTLFGAAAIGEGVMRLSAAWRHLGIVDFLLRNGEVRPEIDAYHNWPGFFALTAFLGSIAGVTNLASLTTWAPVVFNLLYLPALYVVLDTLTSDRRVVWLAIWLFYSTNWIGQDYFAPQAVGFFIYLVALALTLRILAVTTPSLDALASRSGRLRLPRSAIPWLTGVPLRPDNTSPAGRVVVVVVVIAIAAFVVTAHQLTPFFVLASLTSLVVALRLRWFELPVIVGILISAWVAFVAVPFLVGHFQNVAGFVGALGESLQANLTGRLQGSVEHQVVVYLRLATTGGLWLLAAAGVVRRARNGHWDVTAVALALAPFPMFALQAYGGEMLLRIAFFSLPFTALLAAQAFLPRKTGTVGRQTTIAILVLGLVLLASFMVTRYGNERIESFTPNEVSAVETLYDIAPSGSMLAAVSGNLPWKSTRYEEYRYRPIGDDTFFAKPEELIDALASHPGPAFLIITRAQEAYVEMILGQPASAWQAFEARVLSDPRLVIVYRNRDAVIAQYRPITSP